MLRKLTALIAAIALASLGLFGCEREPYEPAGEEFETTEPTPEPQATEPVEEDVQEMGEGLEDFGQDVEQGAEELGQDVEEGTQEMGQDIQQGVDDLGNENY